MPRSTASPRSRVAGCVSSTPARWRHTASSSLPWRDEDGPVQGIGAASAGTRPGHHLGGPTARRGGGPPALRPGPDQAGARPARAGRGGGRIGERERRNKESELLERLQIARERARGEAEQLDAALEAAETEDSEVIDRG